ncbi:hypothetical protein O3G_MSEX004924 [Manduca sexta]|uniref:Uncharacterized protein n=1 Tax=Manduca sexta TaxID=7130 RepID=A0A922CIF7_MANSE|nr:hypothetical protein O3G_MSEX004924 [Manduca sexta]
MVAIGVFALFVLSVIACGDAAATPLRAVSFVPEVADHITKTIKYCMVKHDNDPKIIELVRQGSYGVDEPFKKFIHCAYYKSGYANEDGHVLVNKVIKAFPKDANIEEVTKKCSTIKGEDAEDTTYQFFKCFELNAPIRLALE